MLRRAGLVAAVLLLDRCAAAPIPPPQAAPVAMVTGRLVAVRPLLAATVRQPVLSALGTSPVADPAGAVVECIVLADDGRTLSVVQPDPGGLRPGLRVALRAAPLSATRLAVASAAP